MNGRLTSVYIERSKTRPKDKKGASDQKTSCRIITSGYIERSRIRPKDKKSASDQKTGYCIKIRKEHEIREEQLEADLQRLGYTYLQGCINSQEEGQPILRSSHTISQAEAAKAVLSVWRECPDQVKGDFVNRELWGKIFTRELTARQVVLAVLIYRRSKKTTKSSGQTKNKILNASCGHIAMRMGRRLLNSLGISLARLDHSYFNSAKTLVLNGEVDFLVSGKKVTENKKLKKCIDRKHK